MAITKRDILERISLQIRNENFECLLMLRELCYCGWGVRSDIYILINDLLDRIIELDHFDSFDFDREKAIKQVQSTSKPKCKNCGDNGFTTRFINGVSVRAGCISCQL